jgi:6-phosphofructokinase 1
MLTQEDVAISTLGPTRHDSPMSLSTQYGDGVVNFVDDRARSRYRVEIYPEWSGEDDEVMFEIAGPRQKLFFEPDSTRAAIVTCGGLCPGLNNVIRSTVLQLHYGYGVKDVLGIRYGYGGLAPNSGADPIDLTPARVEHIHRQGGTMLGSSRGSVEKDVMIDFLTDRGIDILFTIGGDGTQTGAHELAVELARRKLPISIVGVPKTIDNDIMYVQRTFGFSTAIERARAVIDCAHVESRGAPNCIALVKLMGRHAGYITAAATVASQDVNFALVPEVPFELRGENGFLPLLVKRIGQRRHAVVVVAEGAGQDLVAGQHDGHDASGNVKLKDIGLCLRQHITDYFSQQGVPMNLKYFDPSYSIRSVPADGDDSVLCDRLARNAVHAAMAGKTDVLIGYWHNVFVHVPIGTAVREKKRMNPEGDLWRAVLSTTGQPVRFGAASRG